MRILYVVSRPLEINTSASIRNRATLLGLVENGHEVELLTTMPDERHSAYDAAMAVNDTVATTYVKLGGVQAAARLGRRLKLLRGLRRLAARVLSRREIYDNLKGIVAHTGAVSLKDKQYDLIISSSDPKSSHLFVLELLRTQGSDFHGRWIQIWGDPFAADITLAAGAKQKAIAAEEHRLLQACDRVVYVSRLTKEMQMAAYPDCADKMTYQPIPYMQATITENRDLTAVSGIKLLYCGDYASGVRDILPLYRAASESPFVQLTVCGASDVPLESTANVQVYPRVPYERVLELEREADVLVHLSNLHGSQIPGKIYQYSGTNKPILFLLDGDKAALRNTFEPYERYVFADNDVPSIVKALQQLQEIPRKDAPVADFSRREISKKIILF